MNKERNCYCLEEIKKGILHENPLFRLCLGICPALAVTTSCENALGMGIATTLVLILSCAAISLLGGFIPRVVRTPAFIIIIATFSSIAEMLMAAYVPSLHEALGVFVPLIAINCLILARAEAFAHKSGLLPTVLDTLGMGAGYTLALLSIALVRELFGFGTVFGLALLPASFDPMQLLWLPPGGFIVLGLLTGLLRAGTAKMRGRVAD